jgi:hypothetical protein
MIEEYHDKWNNSVFNFTADDEIIFLIALAVSDILAEGLAAAKATRHFLDHDYAGGNPGAVKEVGGQTDDALDIAPADEIAADIGLARNRTPWGRMVAGVGVSRLRSVAEASSKCTQYFLGRSFHNLPEA